MHDLKCIFANFALFESSLKLWLCWCLLWPLSNIACHSRQTTKKNRHIWPSGLRITFFLSFMLSYFIILFLVTMGIYLLENAKWYCYAISQRHTEIAHIALKLPLSWDHFVGKTIINNKFAANFSSCFLFQFNFDSVGLYKMQLNRVHTAFKCLFCSSLQTIY